MFKCIYFPDKEIATKEAMFKHLRENEKSIIAIKKASIQKSCEKGGIDSVLFLDKEVSASKGIHLKDGYIYPVINTTLYRDSHKDVHLNGIWNKSLKEQNGKMYYVLNHKLEIGQIISWPQDVNVLVKSVPWSFLGKDYEGNTEALMFEIEKSNIKNAVAKEIIDEKRPVQGSISMQYINVFLAMNSKAKGDEVYLQRYNDYINSIANKEEVEEEGYFYGVGEAAMRNEGSMVVRGSNPITPIKEKTEAGESTSEKQVQIEPSDDTHKFIHRRLI